jgi:hypothetical protein
MKASDVLPLGLRRSGLDEAPAAEPALHTVLLPPSAFRDTGVAIPGALWKKPSEPVEVGLRTLGDAERTWAMEQGVKAADRAYPDMSHDDPEWIERRNTGVIHFSLVRAVCKPDNRYEPFWPLQERSLPRFLEEAAIDRLWEELELVSVADGVLRDEASDEDLAELARDLATGALWEGLSVGRARKVRRVLAFAIELAQGEVLAHVDDGT